MVTWPVPPPDEFYFTELRTGSLFPVRIENVTCRYRSGPLLTLTLGAEDGVAKVFDLKITPDEEGGPGVTGSMVHDLPIGQIIDSVIGRCAVFAVGMVRLNNEAAEGRPHEFLPRDEVSSATQGAIRSRRGRPVSDSDLRRTAEIVSNYDDYDYRQEVRRQLHLTERTASRYISLARKRGFLIDDPAKEG